MCQNPYSESVSDEKLEVVFGQKLQLNDNHTLERVYDLLNQAQGSNLAKESAYQLLRSGKNLADILGELETTNLEQRDRTGSHRDHDG